MKKIFSALAFFFIALSALHSQTLVTSVEAESGVLSGGVTIASDALASGGKYVTNFTASGDAVTITVNVPTTAVYNLTITYRSLYGPKTQDLYTNGVLGGSVVFPTSTVWADLNAGTVSLTAGNNTIAIQKNWGYIDVDKITINTVPLPPATLPATIEAENGVLNGNVSIASDASASGGKYVTNFTATGDAVTITVNVPATAVYNLKITYRSIYGDKLQDLYINGASTGSINFLNSTVWADLNVGAVSLNAGINTIAIQKNYGYIDVDKFTISAVPPPPLPVTIEAESGVLSGGVNVQTDASASGGKYVTNFTAAGDAVTITVNVPTTAVYNLTITYRSPYGDKTQVLYINGSSAGSINFLNSTVWADLNAVAVSLNAGNNTISIQKNYGYIDVDKFTISTVPPPTLPATVEAESGVLSGGVNVQTDALASGGKYVSNFTTTGTVTITVNAPSAGNYNVSVRYRSLYGDKPQNLLINGSSTGSINFLNSTVWADLNAGNVSLNAGSNTIAIQASYGYIDVDKFTITTAPPPPPNVFNLAPALIDANATPEATALYHYLLSQFGKDIISGATSDFYDSVKLVTGKSPLLRAWDFASYSPMYPWNWANGGFAFGPVDNHDAENAIKWYDSTGKKGIVALHWHWGAPSGATAGTVAGTNTFYTQYTDFDVSQAVIPGTQQNTEVLRDIDAIAVQLKKLSDAKVPVLWRPLHEAGGGWFWWGAKGSGPAKALYDIMYNELENVYGLHNLIWVWSTPEASWYPGNSKVDIIGYDSYPGAYNYTPQKSIFDQLYNNTTGNKLIAMSENGPVPDMASMVSSAAPWSYFMTWNNLATAQNTTQHLLDTYNNPSTITLDNYSSTILPVSLSAFTAIPQDNKVTIQWTTTMEANSNHFEVTRSSNGVDFYPLATVTAKGSSFQTTNYTVFDNSPGARTNYYELIQYDNDGKSVNYGIRAVNLNNLSMVSLKVYPNPIDENTGILLSNYQYNKITVSLVDILGKVVTQKDIKTFDGQGYYKLNLGVRPTAGNYILQVHGDGGLRESVKVIVK